MGEHALGVSLMKYNNSMGKRAKAEQKSGVMGKERTRQFLRHSAGWTAGT